MLNKCVQLLHFDNLLAYWLIIYICMHTCSSTTDSAIASTIEETTIPENHLTSTVIQLSGLMDKCSGNCNALPAQCYDCNLNDSCIYGTSTLFDCQVNSEFPCIGDRAMQIAFQCRYCFLTKPNEEHLCMQNSTNCSVTATPQQRVKGFCEAKDNVFCLGNRTFSKMMPCSWTSGYKWSTALILSITVGGFGIDRFYLGYWQEGLGKFFSFGGLGVWTIIDVLLIGTGYLTPSDGSLYV